MGYSVFFLLNNYYFLPSLPFGASMKTLTTLADFTESCWYPQAEFPLV
jgi:hypothetical protein